MKLLDEEKDIYSDNQEIDRLAKDIIEILVEVHKMIDRLATRVIILENSRFRDNAWLN